MAILKEPKTLIESSYLTQGTIGNKDTPGTPLVYYSLVVSSEQGNISGIIEIIQAINAPSIKVNVIGNIRKTNYGHVTNIVSLHGEYVVSVPPPSIGSYPEKFHAYMDINDVWNGTGGFAFRNQKISDVPVTSSNRTK